MSNTVSQDPQTRYENAIYSRDKYAIIQVLNDTWELPNDSNIQLIFDVGKAIQEVINIQLWKPNDGWVCSDYWNIYISFKWLSSTLPHELVEIYTRKPPI